MTRARENFISKVFFSLPCLVFFVCIFFLPACSKRYETIDLSSAPLLPVDSQWGVIIDPYAIYRSEPSLSAAPAGYGRRGDLHEIKGRRILSEEKTQVVWYQFSDGWLPQTSVRVYSNELRAQAAAKEINAAGNPSN